jgi:hypothetical protein
MSICSIYYIHVLTMRIGTVLSAKYLTASRDAPSGRKPFAINDCARSLISGILFLNNVSIIRGALTLSRFKSLLYSSTASMRTTGILPGAYFSVTDALIAS